jgi:hypothetical protein
LPRQGNRRNAKKLKMANFAHPPKL